jgi:TRAP-type C4-dicarboxylate transport system permease small subunit
MPVLGKLNAAVERALLALFSFLFGVMIVDVMIQVVSRNTGVPILWTLDLAQLMFSWCIFLGAAVGVRRGVHYVIVLFPEHMWRTNAVLKLVSVVAIALVSLVMLRYGFAFSRMGASTEVESLGISQYWYFLPIPLSGGLIMLFLVEITLKDLQKLFSATDRTGR